MREIKIFSPTISIGEQLNGSWCMNIKCKYPKEPRIPYWTELYNGKPVLEIVPNYNENKYYDIAIPIKRGWEQIDLSQEIAGISLTFVINILDLDTNFSQVMFTCVVEGQEKENVSTKVNLKSFVENSDEWTKVRIPMISFVEEECFSTKTMRLFHFCGGGESAVLLSDIKIEES